MPFPFRRMAVLLAAAGIASGGAAAADLENTIYLDVEGGRVTIELLPDVAPVHVADRLSTPAPADGRARSPAADALPGSPDRA